MKKKKMKTSQDQQGQQECGDDVTDKRQKRSVLQKSVPIGSSIPAVVGRTAKEKEKMF